MSLSLQNENSPVLQLDDSCLIVDCNGAASNFIGLGKEDIKGRNVSDFLNTDCRKTQLCIGEKNYFFSRFHRSSGEISDVVILASHILEHSKRSHFLTLFDVSSDGSEAGNARSAALKILIGDIAHDLNNILTGILGSLSILREDEVTGKVREELLKNAEEGTIRVREITSKMLAFSRGEVTPVQIPEETRSPERRQPVPVDEPGPGRLLLLEENKFVSQTTVGMLITLGYRVDTVMDGKALLNKYRNSMKSKEPYHAVIMDLTIDGEAGGAVLIRDLLKIDQNAVCILSSGFSGSEIMIEYSSFGFKAALPKPYTVRELFESLNTALMR